MKNTIWFICLITLFAACKKGKEKDAKAAEILAAAVNAHGGKAYENVDVSFDFRKFRVGVKQDEKGFIYFRTQTDSLGQKITDSLNNGFFIRTIAGKKADLSQKDIDKYKEAVNSIAYFVLLPYKLLDKAVNAKYVGEATLEGQLYDKIKVSFDAEGGGKDHTDTFCYWIHKTKKTVDFLAYTNGGPRFRKAFGRTTFKGLVFQNYQNYEVNTKLMLPEKYDSLHIAGQTKLLSEIVQTNFK
jgi:hypothetical protein